MCKMSVCKDRVTDTKEQVLKLAMTERLVQDSAPTAEEPLQTGKLKDLSIQRSMLENNYLLGLVGLTVRSPPLQTPSLFSKPHPSSPNPPFCLTSISSHGVGGRP